MITEKLILDAWSFIRQNNYTIPDKVIEFMRDASIAALKKQTTQPATASGSHPTATDTFMLLVAGKVKMKGTYAQCKGFADDLIVPEGTGVELVNLVSDK